MQSKHEMHYATFNLLARQQGQLSTPDHRIAKYSTMGYWEIPLLS